MRAEQLFIRRYREAESLAASHDEGDLLDLGSRLYQLLMDKHSLIDAVNVRRLPVTFHVQRSFRENPYAQKILSHPSLVLWHREDGIDPSVYPRPDPVGLSRADFLDWPVTLVREREIRVKHVVQYARSAAGGTHLDAHPERFTGEWAVIYGLQQNQMLGGLPYGVRQLQSIARISLRGLAPLFSEVSVRLRLQTGD